MSELEPKLSPGQAAKSAGVWPSVIQKAIQAGTLKAEKVPIVRYEYRILASDLKAWQESKTPGKPRKPKV